MDVKGPQILTQLVAHSRKTQTLGSGSVCCSGALRAPELIESKAGGHRPPLQKNKVTHYQTMPYLATDPAGHLMECTDSTVNTVKSQPEVQPRADQDSATHELGGRLVGSRNLERRGGDPLTEGAQVLSAADELHVFYFATRSQEHPEFSATWFYRKLGQLAPPQLDS
jgi:hypothetical protein